MAAKEGQHPLLLGAFLGEGCHGFELDIVQVGASLVAQMVKRPPGILETCV